MTTHNDTTAVQSETSQPSIDLQDAGNWASGIITAAINMRAHDLLPAEQRHVWEIAGALLGERYSKNTHIAYVRMLDCLIASPETTQEVLKRARNHLLEVDPRIAAYGKVTADPGAPERASVTPPLSGLSRQIDSTGFHLSPEGDLTIEGLHDQAKLVRLTAREAYAVLTFMRLPGVAQLIERLDAEDQAETWREYEADQREEMTREQARALLETDDVLMSQMEYTAAQRFLGRIEEIAAKEKAETPIE